jgi:hypothetical protein
MISDGHGGAIITWQDQRSGSDICGQRLDPAGNPLGTINGFGICDEVGTQTFPILANSTVNEVVVAWMDYRSGTNWDIYTLGVDDAIKINPTLITEGSNQGSQISYTYSDQEAYSNITYYYWLESVSLSGVSEYYGPLSVTIGDPNLDPLPPAMPLTTSLMNAFPNPFNPNTNIRYSLKTAGSVHIDIYNVKGQLLRSFKNQHNEPGYYQISWDGKDSSGNTVSS